MSFARDVSALGAAYSASIKAAAVNPATGVPYGESYAERYDAIVADYCADRIDHQELERLIGDLVSDFARGGR